MEIAAIENQVFWDDFVTSLDDYTFLQSWGWGEINKSQGEKLWRFGLYEGKDLLGICQAFSVSARRGRFLFIPHGPLFREFSKDKLEFFIRHLVLLARENGFTFLRVSPWMGDLPGNRNLFSAMGLRRAPTFMHAENAWLLDLTKDDTTILSEMRKTTRNLINRGLREGIEIKQSNEQSDFDKLYDLQLETARRNHFVPFSKKFLKDEFEAFSKAGKCSMFLGRINDAITAAAVIIFYGKFAFYHVSGSRETKEPVNYVLQWKVIEEAKRRGCAIYNMWGVAPPNKPRHPWVGLSTFKMGFGGYPKDYLPSFDLPLSPLYLLSYFIEKLPRTLRAKLRFG